MERCQLCSSTENVEVIEAEHIKTLQKIVEVNQKSNVLFHRESLNKFLNFFRLMFTKKSRLA